MSSPRPSVAASPTPASPAAPSPSSGRQPEDFIRVGHALKIEALKVHENLLELHYSLDGTHSFITKVLYPSGALAAFEAKFAEAGTPAAVAPAAAAAGPRPSPVIGSFAHRIYSLIALIECQKFIAVFPRTLDVSTVAEGLTESALDFFNVVAERAWSQHAYENEVYDYHGPRFLIDGRPAAQSKRLRRGEAAAPLPRAAWRDESAGEVGDGLLVCNGGGKDSFLAITLLEEAGFPVHVFQHSRTEYGPHQHQHSIQRSYFPHVESLRSGRARRHEISVYDDFTDGTLMALLNPDLRGEAILGRPCQVGWPEMCVESLPFTLLHGYGGLALGNERSADSAQVDHSTLDGGRQVNHQWLKSYEACSALRTFLRSSVAESLEVFSALKPLHDYRIYRLVQRYPHVLPAIHSCNIVKPWCRRCPKCAYVWINLCAIFGEDQLRPIFHENLLDVPELQSAWTDLLGLGAHNAFECVGEVDETRLAFRACADAGLQGRAMDLFQANFVGPDAPRPVDWETVRARFDRVYTSDHGIPEWIFDKLKWRMTTSPDEIVE